MGGGAIAPPPIRRLHQVRTPAFSRERAFGIAEPTSSAGWAPTVPSHRPIWAGRVDQVRVGELRPGRGGPTQVRTLQIGEPDLRAIEVGVRQVGAIEVRALEVCTLKVRP